MKKFKSYIISAICVSTLVISGCGIGGNYIPSDSAATAVSTFKLVPPVNSLQIGGKMKVDFDILQVDGNVPVNPQLEWAVSDSNIAKVDAQGNLEAVAEGNVIVTGTFKGTKATATIAVTKFPPFASDTINTSKGTTIQANPSLLSRIKNIEIKLPTEAKPLKEYTINTIENYTKFIVTAYDLDNKPLEGVVFSWSSSNTTVGTVDNLGNVMTLATGATDIIATAGDKTSNIIRVIVPNGKASINVNFQGD
jgi:uncharacterized protein YjdB